MRSGNEEDQDQWLSFPLSKQLRFYLAFSVAFPNFFASKKKKYFGGGLDKIT
jgi:hypothetical protein